MRSVGLVYRLAWSSGLTRLLCSRAASRGRFVLMFHGVSPRRRTEVPQSLQPFLDGRDLGAVLRWLKTDFTLLTPDEFLSGKLPGVLLTFDDGYRNNHDTALPLLQEHSAPAVFFVTTQHVADPHDWLPAIREELEGAGWSEGDVAEELARDLFDGMDIERLARCASTPGIEIGSHTLGHPLLTQLGDEALATEVRESRLKLEEWTGTPVRQFAYPTGDYDLRVARAVEAAGYVSAFVENVRDVDTPGRYAIPRIGLYQAEPWYLAAKLSGLFRPPIPLGIQLQRGTQG